MENETIPEVEQVQTNTEEQVVETQPETPAPQVQKEERPPETLEARRARLQRELKATEKKLGLTEEKPSKKKTDELDFGQLAFHNSKSDSVKIEHDDDINFLKQTIADTGKTQQQILSAKWFAAELKEKQEARSVAQATPSANRSTSAPANTTVDYWIAKGQLPPDPELRTKVVNRKIEIARGGGKV